MKLTSNIKILRKILILCLLTVGLALVASNEATPVSAKTCYDANNDFYGALDTFDTAFNSLYRPDPSCSTQCMGFQLGTPQRQECEDNCRQTRRTNLDNAELGILQAGGDIESCTNAAPEECADARARNDYCLATYNYSEYSDPNERLDIYTAYSACRDGSGVNRCQ